MIYIWAIAKEYEFARWCHWTFSSEVGIALEWFFALLSFHFFSGSEHRPVVKQNMKFIQKKSNKINNRYVLDTSQTMVMDRDTLIYMRMFLPL